MVDFQGVVESGIDSHVVTFMSTKMHRFKWTLKDFDCLPDTVTGPQICPQPWHVWNLILHKQGGCVRLELHKTSYAEFILKCRSWVIDNNTRINERKWTMSFSKRPEVKDIPERIPLPILHNDELVLEFDFRLMQINNCLRPVDGPEYNGRKKFAEDFERMYKDSKMTDAVLLVDGGHVNAHKCILCARSPVFEKMFLHRTDESDKNTVHIDDLNLTVVQKLVSFLSTGVVEAEKDLETACQLYYAADKYEVLDLREMVGLTLSSMLTEDNATRILVLADRHCDNTLKRRVMEFICANLEDISETDSWEPFVASETKLSAEFTIFYCKKQNMAKPDDDSEFDPIDY